MLDGHGTEHGAADAAERQDDEEYDDDSDAAWAARPPTSFSVARAHVAGFPGFARIAFVLFVLLDWFPDVAGLAGLDELVRR